MKTTVKINAERITTLRTKCGLTQKELAGKVKVDSGTVSRWERGEIDRVRQDIFGKLCSALGATEDQICGDGPLPEPRPVQPEAPKGQMNLSIDPACRNALALVASRYRVTRQQIVEAAPLLFLIAAEQSLRKRQERLEALQEAADAVFRAQLPHLPPHYPLDDMALDVEKRSIKTRDLFATICAEDENVGIPHDWNEERDNPFAQFLSKALANVMESAEPVDWAPGRSCSPSFRICPEEAAALVGDDAEATDAILRGQAALREMPKSSPAERAQWARAERQAREREVAELLATLFDEYEPEKIETAIAKIRENGTTVSDDGATP